MHQDRVDKQNSSTNNNEVVSVTLKSEPYQNCVNKNSNLLCTLLVIFTLQSYYIPMSREGRIQEFFCAGEGVIPLVSPSFSHPPPHIFPTTIPCSLTLSGSIPPIQGISLKRVKACHFYMKRVGYTF
jgi:hypothetical protein